MKNTNSITSAAQTTPIRVLVQTLTLKYRRLLLSGKGNTDTMAQYLMHMHATNAHQRFYHK